MSKGIEIIINNRFVKIKNLKNLALKKLKFKKTSAK